jgi:nucleoside-diphosphate-sugar epimerase
MGCEANGMKALVTGGGGFLGKALVRKLLDRGWSVQTLNRGEYPDLDDWGVTTFRGDIADYDSVYHAAKGCDIVFHTAANAGVWGPYEEYYRPNVLGTRNVIDACRQLEIPKLVNTSSPSVVFSGADQEGIDESTPYPKRFLAYYPQTKAAAEQMVMKANGKKLATVSLRPHLIWGPDDNQLVPRVIERAKAGKLRIVGSGDQKVDAVYIDNAVEAHVCAALKLNYEAGCAGKTYFITNDEPVEMSIMINGVLEAAGLPPVKKKISTGMAVFAGFFLEMWYKLLRKNEEPMMTRFVAKQLGTAHWYSLDAAKNDLGYSPSISMVEGFEHLRQSLALTTDYEGEGENEPA